MIEILGWTLCGIVAFVALFLAAFFVGAYVVLQQEDREE